MAVFQWSLFLCVLVIQHTKTVKCDCVADASDCSGLEGKYQSCKGCNMYAECSYGEIYERQCKAGTFWDDRAKDCVQTSTTCGNPDPIECGTNRHGTKRELLDVLLNKEHPMSKRIAGGSESLDGQWPWMAALIHTGDDERCGGTLISDRWVLTAGHCIKWIEDEGRNEFTVQVGDNTFRGQSDQTQTRGIDFFIAHEDYFNNVADRNVPEHERRMYNDIGLIRLSHTVNLIMENANIICLAQKTDQYADDTCTVAGWGKISEFGGFSPVLKHVRLDLWERNFCVPKIPNDATPVSEGFICSSSSQAVDFCRGDSGGPLMCKNQDDVWMEFGIVSWGWGCARNEYPGVYVDVREYFGWIEDTIISNGGY